VAETCGRNKYYRQYGCVDGFFQLVIQRGDKKNAVFSNLEKENKSPPDKQVLALSGE